MCRMVAVGLVVGIVDPFTAQQCVSLGLTIRPLEPVFEYAFGFLYPIRSPRSRLAQRFAHIAEEIVAEYPYQI